MAECKNDAAAGTHDLEGSTVVTKGSKLSVAGQPDFTGALRMYEL